MRVPQIIKKFMRQTQRCVATAPQPIYDQQPNVHVVGNPKLSSAPNHLLYGQTGLITGAGRNIGRSIALEMAAQGANIVFTDIDHERTVLLEKELGALKVNARGIVSDVSSPRDNDSLLSTLTREEISIDFLVNNAGVGGVLDGRPKTVFDQWQNTFSANLFGPMHLTEAIVPGMKARGSGSILFITSIHQWVVMGSPTYSTTKAALGMLIKEFAVKLAPFHIRVNGIAPGWVEEDGERKVLTSDYSLLHRTSINPEYIGRAAVYLASDYFSKFTTGTVLKIDDGLSLSHPYSNNQHETS